MLNNKKQNKKFTRRVKFFTLGCKVNQYETRALEEKFSFRGYETTKDKADLYVINTCTVTRRADTKSREAILRAKKENPKAIIAVCGCLTRFNKEFIEKLGVDYIIPQEEKHLLPEIVLSLPADEQVSGDIWQLKIGRFSNQRAFIKVQDGCDNFCSFCKIPYLRGRSRSRPKKDVLEEVARISSFHREVVLCGINLSLYGRDLPASASLEGLVEEILEIPSLGQLRLSSLEPAFVGKKLFSFLNNSKFCPHFHFPFQYGDDRVLKDMNKKENVALYEKVAGQARQVNPDTAISCDIMVGYPSEDEQSFKNTVDFLCRLKPMRAHIFTFSPRENTPLAGFKVKNRKAVLDRYNFLKKMAEGFSREYAKKFLGKVLNVIAEETKQGWTSGYTQNYIKVYVRGQMHLGDIIPVKIDEVKKDKVTAKLEAK